MQSLLQRPNHRSIGVMDNNVIDVQLKILYYLQNYCTHLLHLPPIYIVGPSNDSSPDPLTQDSLPQSRSVWLIQDFYRDLISDRGKKQRNEKAKEKQRELWARGMERYSYCYI
jgi:hypothetical protein